MDYIAIGGDHAGFALKEKVIAYLKSKDLAFKDFGPETADSVDYPDFAHPVAIDVEKGNATLGILICGSGNGVCIAANKHSGIRAALAWAPELAALARAHNDANIICLPARYISEALAMDIVETFLKTPFEGGRHQYRIEKIPIEA